MTRRRREPHHNAKLTPDDVQLIRALAAERAKLREQADRISQKALAEKFGVSQTTISCVENYVYYPR